VNPANLRSDLDTLRRDLVARADILFRDCWGDPRNPNAARWRPARRKPGDDPRRMMMQGPQRGLWYDSRSGQGGDLFDFLAVERLGLTKAQAGFPRVLEEAGRWLGRSPALLTSRPCSIEKPPDLDAVVSAELLAVLAAAELLTGRALRYWTETRNLDLPPRRTILRLPGGALSRRPPGSLLPFADREAVLVLGRDVHGSPRAIQRIILAQDGIGRDSALPKFALGPIGTFPPFFAAVAVEADAPDNPSAQALTRAIAEARAAGAVIGLLRCGGAPGSGYDAADLIREEGGRARLGTLVADLAARLHWRRC